MSEMDRSFRFPRFNRRTFIQFGSIPFAMAAFTACSNRSQVTSGNSIPSSNSLSENQQSGVASKEIRLGSFAVAVDYAPYLIAKNKGWFDALAKKQGNTINYALFQSLPPINEAFATGGVDIVFEAEPPAIVAKAAGIDVKIVAISCSLVQEILVPKDSKTYSAKDLKGKKIAVLKGTSSHYGLTKILKEVGIGPNDVEVIDLAPPDAKSAFETGQVDAWAVWPPFIEQEEISGKGRVLPRGNVSINSIMAVRGEFAKNHRETLVSIIKIVQNSKNWIQQNPVEAQKIVAKELNIPVEIIVKAWPSHDWRAQIHQEIIDDIQAKADFFKENGFIQKSVDVKRNLIDTSFLS